jgi:predicted transcriptional regulator
LIGFADLRKYPYQRIEIREIKMSAGVLATTDKEFAIESLRRMPDDVSMEQISEELAILAAIRRGESAADSGRVLTHDEVTRRSAAWTSK